MNTSENNTLSSETSGVSRAFIAGLQTVIVFIIILGVIGNALTMVVIATSKKLRTMGNLFIFNLSLADSLYFAVVLPARFAILQSADHCWSDSFCLFVATVGHLLIGVSLISLSAIAANRLTQVVFPQHYRIFYSRRCMYFHICSIWSGSAFCSVVLPVAGIYGHFTYQRKTYSCTYTPGVDKGYSFLISASGLCVPSVFILVCYTYIYFFVKAQKGRLKSWKVGPVVHISPTRQHSGLASGSRIPIYTNTDRNYPISVVSLGRMEQPDSNRQTTVSEQCPTISATNGSKDVEQKVRTKQSDGQRRDAVRMTVMMVCIFIVLSICICPYFLVQVMGEEKAGPRAYLLATSMTWINGCANPVIYAMMNVQFRAAYRNILFRQQ